MPAHDCTTHTRSVTRARAIKACGSIENYCTCCTEQGTCTERPGFAIFAVHNQTVNQHAPRALARARRRHRVCAVRRDLPPARTFLDLPEQLRSLNLVLRCSYEMALKITRYSPLHGGRCALLNYCGPPIYTPRADRSQRCLLLAAVSPAYTVQAFRPPASTIRWSSEGQSWRVVTSGQSEAARSSVGAS